jgi:hypothetical protein
MFKNWNSRSISYLLLAIAGLVGTWYFNFLAIAQSRNFFADWSSTPAVLSATTDLFVVATAASVFIFFESKRLKIKYWWLFILGSFITAIAFTFPLFLAFRERKMSTKIK